VAGGNEVVNLLFVIRSDSSEQLFATQCEVAPSPERIAASARGVDSGKMIA
jgi:hypothetical protein